MIRLHRPLFVDAGAWIAISHPRDRHHTLAVAFHRHSTAQRRRLVTTNLVLAEAYVMVHRFGGYASAMAFLATLRESNRLTKVYSTPALETEAESILRSYADQDFSLTDAVSFALMRAQGIDEAFGFDNHFVTAGFSLSPR
ncbi:MAG: PIN domain-containing protein [Vicinamibacterales bacterium]